MTKNCLVCNNPFTTCLSSVVRGRGKFCSCKCAHAFRRGKPNGRKGIINSKSAIHNHIRVELICKSCAISFFVIPFYVTRRKYCSYKCSVIPNSQKQVINIVKQCLWDGREFFSKPWERYKKYCSDACKVQYRKNNSWAKTKIIIDCLYCKKRFGTWACRIKDGKKFCSKKCANRYDLPAKRIKLLNMRMNQAWDKKPTSLEKIVYQYLNSLHIRYEKQKLIGNKFIVDAYIPSKNLIIEIDGRYWHTQPRVIKKDYSENLYLRKCGFNLIRLREEVVHSGKFKNLLPLVHGN